MPPMEKTANTKQEDEVLYAEDVNREADRQENEGRKEREAWGCRFQRHALLEIARTRTHYGLRNDLLHCAGWFRLLQRQGSSCQCRRHPISNRARSRYHTERAASQPASIRMYVAKQSRWIDPTLRNLLGDWSRRVEERFAGVDGILSSPSPPWRSHSKSLTPSSRSTLEPRLNSSPPTTRR